VQKPGRSEFGESWCTTPKSNVGGPGLPNHPQVLEVRLTPETFRPDAGSDISMLHELPASSLNNHNASSQNITRVKCPSRSSISLDDVQVARLSLRFAFFLARLSGARLPPRFAFFPARLSRARLPPRFGFSLDRLSGARLPLGFGFAEDERIVSVFRQLTRGYAQGQGQEAEDEGRLHACGVFEDGR
jgi:hypothetical protein